MEEELSWKSAFMDALANSAMDGIIVVDSQGRKILQNQRAADIFQIPRHIADDPDDTFQVKWVMAMTRHPERFIDEVIHLYSHPDEVSRDEIELNDGTLLDRNSSPVTGKDGTRYGRIWTFHDSPLRKQTEKALKESEECFADAFEHAPIGMALVSTEGRWLKVNRALCKLVGYSEAELLSRNFQEITCPEDLSIDLKAMHRLLSSTLVSYRGLGACGTF